MGDQTTLRQRVNGVRGLPTDYRGSLTTKTDLIVDEVDRLTEKVAALTDVVKDRGDEARELKAEFERYVSLTDAGTETLEKGDLRMRMEMLEGQCRSLQGQVEDVRRGQAQVNFEILKRLDVLEGRKG